MPEYKEYHKYIPKTVRKAHPPSSSWKKYASKNEQSPIPWTDLEDKERSANEPNLLEGHQESFSFAKDHKGPARLFQCSFKRDFSVDRLVATQCSFQNIVVRGDANLRESSLQGNGRILGNLSAYALSIQGNLEVRGPTLRLRNVTLQGDLLISDSVENPATLYVEDGTVSGNIHFKSGKGTLFTKGNVIMDGTIIGVLK